ncbi:MAG: hypothetical protein KC416_05100 [Myxococcales bacterium]|nr:hypothetical protein [Myxococcales bacterium]
MLSKDIAIDGFDAASWAKIVSLFSPDQEQGATVFIFLGESDEVLAAYDTGEGRFELDSFQIDDLPEVVHRRKARWGVALRRGAIEELEERMALRLRRGEDYVAQLLTSLRVLRELHDSNQIRICPDALTRVPVPSPAMVRRALDTILPDGHTALAVLWQRGDPWSAVAIRRSGGAIDHVVGPETIARWTGPLGGDWRRDHRVVVQAVSRELGPVHIGLFSEVGTMRDLLRNPNPGAWATAAAVRDVAFFPSPPYVTAALGADLVRAAAEQTAQLVGGLGILETVVPLAAQFRARVTDMASVTATLGFNPLRVLGEMLRGEGTDRSSDSK